ncbi:hypothetical protein AB0M45_29405 [Nocardia sp. NPDC051787]|uniref:hypothetical protein n=1 Tax=Nocardia sp. NPDC051787 TaxID=3155415 RepID=UPI003422B239
MEVTRSARAISHARDRRHIDAPVRDADGPGLAHPRFWPDRARPPLASVTAQRPIVRRMQCGLLSCAAAEAIRVTDAMDYDAQLLIDADTGEDVVVCGTGPFEVRLARHHHMQPPDSPLLLPLTVNPHHSSGRVELRSCGGAVE